MTSINDFATTYMCQSLPFGGVKESGFDRFAGIEGLRGLTVPKAVAEDRWGQPRLQPQPQALLGKLHAYLTNERCCAVIGLVLQCAQHF